MTKVTCEEARLQLCADPRTSSTELSEHLTGCEGCRTYQSGMAVLEADLRRAFDLGPVLPARKTPPPRQRRQRLLPAQPKPPIRRRTWAMAASVVLAVLGGVLLWTVRTPDSLAKDLEEHVKRESPAWAHAGVVDPGTIEKVMHNAHLQLVTGQDQVVFARVCLVHGHLVPHLVVRTTQGSISVVVLPDEPASASSSIHEGNVTGVLLPAPRGSIAVLTQQGEISPDVARALKDEVRWLPVDAKVQR